MNFDMNQGTATFITPDQPSMDLWLMIDYLLFYVPLKNISLI